MNLNTNNVNFKRTSTGVLTLNNAKIKGFGKSKIDLKANELIFNAIESNYTIKKYVNNIDFLIYSKGNFLFDDTIYMGIDGEQFEIICKENEGELRNFYDTLLKVKKENTTKILETKQENTTNNSSNNQQLEEKQEETKNSASEEIRNFYNLMKEGIISEEEFEEKKKELLKSK